MTAAESIIEALRTQLDIVDHLDPADRDAIYSALVADLRSRRPSSVSPLTLGPPTDVIRDPRGQR